MIVYRLDATWVRVGRVGASIVRSGKKILGGRSPASSHQDIQNERDLVRCTWDDVGYPWE